MVVASGLFVSASLAIMQTWIPSYLARVHHLGRAETGALLGVLSGPVGVVGALAGGWLAGTLGRRDPRWLYACRRSPSC